MTLNVRLFHWMVLCLVLGFASCSPADLSVFGDDFDVPELTDENTIQFTIDVKAGEWKQFQLVAGGGRMAIEWGDGRLQKIANPENDNSICYQYGNSRTYHVRIWAEELEFCNIESLLIPTSNLRMGYLPKMKTLLLNSLVNTSMIDLSSSCPNLELVSIGNCLDLESLDIEGCARLKDIQIYTLPRLSSLKLGHHPDLEGISCMGNDQIKSLSLKGLPSLNYLLCYNNPLLSALEFDNDSKLSTLRIDDCAFRTVDFLSQLPQLTQFSCSSNQLTELNLSNQYLYHLNCSDNSQLTSLEIPEINNLQMLECYSCKLDKNVLNSIFSRLHRFHVSDPSYGKAFYISYYNNPGEKYCDKDLLQGWRVGRNPSESSLHSAINSRW